MKKKKIGVDLDEVLAELFRGCIEIHGGKLWDVDITFEESLSYNLDEHFQVSRETVVNFFYKPLFDRAFEKYILPVEWAFEKLQHFHSLWYEIHVVTARRDIVREQTLRFLDTHYAGLIHDVHFANHFGDNPVDKHDICLKIGVEMMVEDNIDYALGIAKSGILTYLIEKPWNRERKEKHRLLKRISWWEEINVEETY